MLSGCIPDFKLCRASCRLRLQIVSGFDFYFDSYSFIKPKQSHARLDTLAFIQVYMCFRLLEFVYFAFMVEEFRGAMISQWKVKVSWWKFKVLWWKVRFCNVRISWWIIERMAQWWMAGLNLRSGSELSVWIWGSALDGRFEFVVWGKAR